MFLFRNQQNKGSKMLPKTSDFKQQISRQDAWKSFGMVKAGL